METGVDILVHMLDEGYDRKAWHGTTLRGSLRKVSREDAAWRPGKQRHNIWEVTVHCAYWKYAVWRRLTGEKRGSFALPGSNWFTRPVRGRSWEEDVKLLDEAHARLRTTVLELAPELLPIVPHNAKLSNMELIVGIAAHDLYHAGQIQLLKRLLR